MKMQRSLGPAAIATAIGLGVSLPGVAAADESSFEIYGFAQLDYIQDFGRVNPDWVDTLRPSRIPTDEGQFGSDGQTSFSVKQSRIGVQGNLPTARGDIYTKFEIDLFGVGEDEGQTTIRLRHVYGEYGQILAGQTNSLFMNGDIFPNSIDYWGPAGMVFLRNPQIRWTPIKGNSLFAIAVEKPGNDIDAGEFRTVQGFPGAQGKQELPDLTAQFRQSGDFGYLQLSGILRKVTAEVVDDVSVDPNNPDFETIYEDSDIGWGLNLTTVINLFRKDAIRAGLVYGEGIASYMNDGGMDAAPDRIGHL